MKHIDLTYPNINNYTHIKTLDGEEWMDVISHVGFYSISNFGRVRRNKVIKNNSDKFWDELILKANNDSKGYPQVTLSLGGRRAARVHRLVAEAFLGSPPQIILDENKKAGINLALVNHKDENRCNACIENLEWCTVCYNNRYSNTPDNYKKIRGGNNCNSILIENDVRDIITLLDEGNISQEKIAELFNVKQMTISNINTGRSWAWFTGRKWTPRSRPKKSNSIPISSEDVH